MAYWHMTGRVTRHPEIRKGERVLHACYGLSASFTRMGNAAASGLSSAAKRHPDVGNKTEFWEADFEGKEGLAAVISRTGVLALTTERLIYFKKTFAIGSPKEILATWPLE